MYVPHLKVNRVILGDFLFTVGFTTVGCEMSACQKQADVETTYNRAFNVAKPQETRISLFLFNIPDTEMKITPHHRLC